MRRYKKYKRTNIAEMREVTQSDIDVFRYEGCIPSLASDVSISEVDLDNGSPKIGDMIARNPNNHNDEWLVAKEYFENNFELLKERS